MLVTRVHQKTKIVGRFFSTDRNVITWTGIQFVWVANDRRKLKEFFLDEL